MLQSIANDEIMGTKHTIVTLHLRENGFCDYNLRCFILHNE